MASFSLFFFCLQHNEKHGLLICRLQWDKLCVESGMCLSFEIFRLKSFFFFAFFFAFFFKSICVCVLILTWPVSMHQSVRVSVCVRQIQEHRTQDTSMFTLALHIFVVGFLFYSHRGPRSCSVCVSMSSQPGVLCFLSLLCFWIASMMTLEQCTILEELLGGECCREGPEGCLFRRGQPAPGAPWFLQPLLSCFGLPQLDFSWVRDGFM